MDTRLIPITQWNKFHAWPPIGGLRHLIHNRDKNGFDAVLVRPTRVWLIDEKKFFKWMKERGYTHPIAERNKNKEKKNERRK